MVDFAKAVPYHLAPGQWGEATLRIVEDRLAETPCHAAHSWDRVIFPEKRVHRVVSLLKRWLLGTHQGAVTQAHLDYYRDEFTFRFNRRRSRHRGKRFFRLVQQAVATEPIPTTAS